MRKELILGALTLVSMPALADDAGSFDAYIGTDFPVSVGADATYELPMRLRGEVAAGFMPAPYVDAINAGLTGFDIYSDTVADLIDAVLNNALVLRMEVGYRPWSKYGFTGSAGYQYLHIFGNTADLTYFAEGVDEKAIDAVQQWSGDLVVNAGLHQVRGELGWERAIKGPWRLRVIGAFAYTFTSGTRVKTTREPSDPAQEAGSELVTTEAAEYLDFVFQKWVHLPTIGVSAGRRF